MKRTSGGLSQRALLRGALVVCQALVLALSMPGTGAAVAQSDVDRLLDAMSPAERVGQLFVLTFVGSNAGDGTDVAALIDDAHIGGVVLAPSRGNFVNQAEAPIEVARLANALQSRSAATPGPYVPLLIAVSERGDGTSASALYGGMTPLPSPMALGATWDPDNALRVGEIVGREMAAVGVNLLLGPGLDVLGAVPQTGSGDLGVDAFGGSPSWVARFGKQFVEGVHVGSTGRVAVVPSSFPGVGGVDRSPTDEIAVVERTLEELTVTDLVPFLAVVDAPEGSTSRADGLMTSHVRFRGIQQQADRPFSLDSGGLRYLTAQLAPLATWRSAGGVIVSPGLGLPAVRRYVDPDLVEFNERRVVDEALAAGNDLLVMTELDPSGDPVAAAALARDAMSWLAQRYDEDETVRVAVDRAARRVLALKRQLYGGFPRQPVTVDAEQAAQAVGLGRDLVSSVARDALTALAPAGAQEAATGTASPEPGDRIVFVVDARATRDCAACEPYLDPDPARLLAVVRRNYGAEGTGRLQRSSDVDAMTFVELRDWLQSQGLAPVDDRSAASEPIPTERRADVDAMLGRADWIVAMMRDVRPTRAPSSIAFKQLLSAGPPQLAESRLVAVALAAPYYLDTTEIAKLSAYYALYAHAEPFVEVAVRAFFGDVPATGASPVSVPGAGYDLLERLEPDPSQSVTLAAVGLGPDAALRVGDAFTVRTSVIRDANGRPAPDGTRVTFQRFDRTEGAFLADVAALSRDGQATAAMRADRDGELAITAAFDNGLRSEPLALVVQSADRGSEALSLPDVPLPPALVLSRVPVDWGIFLLSLTLILLVGVLFYGVETESRTATQQVRLFLLSLAWGLAGYLLVAAGGLELDMLPGPLRWWPERWNPAYQAAVLSFLLAVVPVAPSIGRSLKGSRLGRWSRLWRRRPV